MDRNSYAVEDVLNSLHEQVVLVDAADQQIGVADKQSAHVDGALHRAFSVFLFNSAGELLLQKRASSKYHSGGLWTNTCCGHPRPGEPLAAAARRRLQEEMGLDCELSRAFQFSYRAELENGLIENEIDHVFVGSCDLPPRLNADEAEAFRWLSLDRLQTDINRRPTQYSYWLRHCFPRICKYRGRPLDIDDARA